MSVQNEGSSSKEMTELVSQGLESMSLGEDDNEEGNNEGVDECSSKVYFQVDTVDDFGHIMFDLSSPFEIRQFHFHNLDIAYKFYNEYGRALGFSIRKHKVGYTSSGEPKKILWKSFVCSRQGFRDDKFTNNSNRQRVARANTRCGCNASFCVHVDATSGRWFVSSFEYEHNHELPTDKFAGRLRSHRGMSDADIAKMNSMKNAGISTPKIFAAFSRQSGGSDKVGFGIKDMYNKIDKQRKMRDGDAKTAIRRCTKNAKDGVDGRVPDGVSTDMSNRMSRFRVLEHCCRRLCSVACRSVDDFNRVREMINAEIEKLLATNNGSIGTYNTAGSDLHDNVRDPGIVLSKGLRTSSQNREKKLKKVQRCTTGRTVGHNNKRKCPYESEVNESIASDSCSEWGVEWGVEEGQEEGDGRNGDDEMQYELWRSLTPVKKA